MQARWLFGFVVLAYLFGPARAGVSCSATSTWILPPEAVPPAPKLAELFGFPVAAAVRAAYPGVSPNDLALRAGRLFGSLCTAGAVALTFLALRRRTSGTGGLLLALGVAFASPLWSWTSRADPPETLAVLLVAALLWLPAQARPLFWGDTPGVAAGGLAAGLLFLDPVSLAATPALAMLARQPSSRSSWAALLGGGAGTTTLLVWLQGMPPDGLLTWLQGRFGAPDPIVASAYLVSPGRGLVWFAPVVGLAALALRRGATPFARHGALVVLAVLVESSFRREPWGPLGFGPTLLAPYLPLLALMAAELPVSWLRAGALLSLPAALAHGGAVFAGGHTWDERRAIILEPQAVWDLRDSPFSDLVFGAPPPDVADFSAARFFLRPGLHPTRAGAAAPWLVYGWEAPEPRGTWASGRESWIALAAPPGEYRLTLVASAPRLAGRAQRIEVERPGAAPLELGFAKQLWQFESLTIPFHAERNLTVLRLRPAHTWMPGHGDVRHCSLFLAGLRLTAVDATPR